MGSNPDKPGPNDKNRSDDDVHTTVNNKGEITASESADPNATINSIDELLPEAVPNRGGQSDVTVEKTLNSLDDQDSGQQPMNSPRSPSGEGKEVTSPSQPPAESVADSRGKLAKMSQDPHQTIGTRTDRGKQTAGKIDATLYSVPGLTKSDDNKSHVRIPPTKAQPQLPSHVGRYEIKRLLGEGTFGKVYQARDPQLDRIVAVKVAKAISGRMQVKRFLREARAAAKLRHPNIIPVYEYGQVDGENIIVYEFVEGETLKSYLQRKELLPLEKSVEIVRGIAEGLNYAHEQGIIHRDVKPDNIMIDSSGRPHIADFGCARSIEDTTSLTVDGSILGTPMYMSPEQAGGKANLADGRTDIWSLGVMLYEMTSGMKPFYGQLSDLLFWICNKDASPLRKVRPEVPRDIETICGKCLMRELDKRFSTAKVLSDELARFQRGEPIESRRVGTIQRTWMWAKRNQAVASLMATVAITLLIGIIVSSTFAIQAYLEKQRRANTQMNALTTSEAAALPGIFTTLTEFRGSILPKLYENLKANDTSLQEKRRLRMAIVELEQDQALRKSTADEMAEDLLIASPEDFVVTRDCLEFRKPALTDMLWTAAANPNESSNTGKRFRAAAALALYDPNSSKWASIAPNVAGYLTSVNEVEMSYWLPAVQPIRDSLKPTLVAAYLDQSDEVDTTPQRAAAILSRLFGDEIEFLVSLIPDAQPRQIPYLTVALKANQPKAVAELKTVISNTTDEIQKSNLATALIQLADQSQWNQFTAGSDMSVATELIQRLGPASTSVETLVTQINQWKSTDADILSGILLSLGQYKQNQILDEKDNLNPILLSIFSEHANARVHSCARWLLQEWGFKNELVKGEKKLRRRQPDPKMNWHVDLVGNTFALFGPVDDFEMGLSDAMAMDSGFDPTDFVDEPRHRKTIPRRFGICIHEVTNAQFLEFDAYVTQNYERQIVKLEQEIAPLADANDDESKQRIAKLTKDLARVKIRYKASQRERKRRLELDGQHPVGNVDFFTSMGYCRWLSEREQLEFGRPSVEDLQELYLNFPKSDFKITQAELNQLGYRLPTSTEWEYACRGRSETLFPFGKFTTEAKHYAWYATNSDNRLHPVGKLKPGNTGLFDGLGNVNEWCVDWYRDQLPKSADMKHPDDYVDHGPEFENHQSLQREFRGGSFLNEIIDVRSTKRFSIGPNQGYPYLGFRLARTYEPSTDVESSSASTQSE